MSNWITIARLYNRTMEDMTQLEIGLSGYFRCRSRVGEVRVLDEYDRMVGRGDGLASAHRALGAGNSAQLAEDMNIPVLVGTAGFQLQVRGGLIVTAANLYARGRRRPLPLRMVYSSRGLNDWSPVDATCDWREYDTASPTGDWAAPRERIVAEAGRMAFSPGIIVSANTMPMERFGCNCPLCVGDDTPGRFSRPGDYVNPLSAAANVEITATTNGRMDQQAEVAESVLGSITVLSPDGSRRPWNAAHDGVFHFDTRPDRYGFPVNDGSLEGYGR